VKAVILAGGAGIRLSPETALRPKPMVEVGGKPLLWHIMKIYSAYGVNDFVVCCGYMGYVIKEYFANYLLHTSDVTVDMSDNRIQVHSGPAEPWRVTLADTGESSMTGGRLKRAAAYLAKDEEFFLTYGDAVANIDIPATLAFHRGHGKAATVTATVPPGRFGALEIADRQVKTFTEKAARDGGWINGGFFVLSPSVLDYITDDSTVWEQEPLMRLAEDGELMAYQHHGFWQPMDTLREKQLLEELWSKGVAPWKTWD
jgi:glucose-1-phosphate cytidylyltransferase